MSIEQSLTHLLNICFISAHIRPGRVPSYSPPPPYACLPITGDPACRLPLSDCTSGSITNRMPEQPTRLLPYKHQPPPISAHADDGGRAAPNSQAQPNVSQPRFVQRRQRQQANPQYWTTQPQSIPYQVQLPALSRSREAHSQPSRPSQAYYSITLMYVR